RGDPGRRGGPRAHRGSAAQLALPARPAHRRLRRPRAAVPRLMFPAEWEPHQATWLAWPHNVRDWPGKFAPIPWVYAEIVRRISAGETVRLLVGNPPLEARARAVLKKAEVDVSNVEVLRIPTDRAWTRDSGPIFLNA